MYFGVQAFIISGFGGCHILVGMGIVLGRHSGELSLVVLCIWVDGWTRVLSLIYDNPSSHRNSIVYLLVKNKGDLFCIYDPVSSPFMHSQEP